MRILVPLLLALLSVPLPGRAETLDDGTDVVPGRLVVKYRPSVDACVHCLLAHGVPLARQTGRTSLDELHADLGVRGARAVFLHHHSTRGGRSAAWVARTAAAQRRFAARSGRASIAAGVPDLSRVYVLDLPEDADVSAAAVRYAADPDVEYAEPERTAHATLTPNDPFFSTSGSWGQPYRDLFGLVVTDAATAWNTATGTGTVVAIVDTGIDATHPDLAANLWTNPGEIAGNGLDDDGNGYPDDVHGWDFVDVDGDPQDLNGHGTHCAGTVAATGNNALGVVGMAWNARIMGVRGLAPNGVGGTTGLSEGLVYAAENGADVISNSWGGGGPSQVLVDAVATARGLGSVVVAAAGNAGGSVDNFRPAAIPGVIAVGATDAFDDVAGFSNFGDALSVSAPGVDVLSLKAGVVSATASGVVGTNYLRLSGTSMATPHVAGLAALLLSDQPSLTVDEVRWHLELNADQPGYPGYESEPWNPHFGWGRIDAARVFDAPPVTTRLRPKGFDIHGYSGVVNADIVALDLEFTTVGPVDWTVASPPWLTPSAGAGAGAAQLTFALDGTGLSPGNVSGAVVVDAPMAVDGGAAVPVAAGVHRDDRVGDESIVAPGIGFVSEMRAASDGVSTFVVWIGGGRVYGARLDASGDASPTIELAPGPHPLPGSEGVSRTGLDVTTDGREFLVTWVETAGAEFVRALRVSADGEPFPGRAAFVFGRTKKDERILRNSRVAFDGTSYLVLWDEFDTKKQRSKIYFRRIGSDGTTRSKRRKLYPGYGSEAGAIVPRLACGAGRCLVAWKEGNAVLSNGGKLVPAHGWGVPVAGDRVAGSARGILIDVDDLVAVRSDGTGYVVLGWRQTICPGLVACGEQVVAVHVDASATTTGDNAGTRLDVGPPNGTADAFPTDLAYDGTNWLATFVSSGRIFGARMAPDGTRLDDELIGLLLSPATTAQKAAIVATRTDALVVWNDTRYPHPTDGGTGLVAQRTLAHAPAPALVEIAIGSIGARSGAEGTPLAFTVSAPTLAPSAVYTVTGLPPGAVFDVPTRTFRWVPAPDQVGTYPSVHFEADDGVATVSEDVTLVIDEAVRSISGTVTFSGGGPAPFMTLRLVGAPGKRLVVTDAAGRYRFDDLVSKSYRVKLDAVNRGYGYVAAPTEAVVGDFDVAGVDLVVTLK